MLTARTGTPVPAFRSCSAQHRRRRALLAGAAATTPGDDVAWLGSRFAAGAEQRAQELQMVALKERLASDSAAEHAGANQRSPNTITSPPHSRAVAFVRSLDGLAATECDRAAASANHGRSSLAAQVRRACEVVQDGLVERDAEVRCLNETGLVGRHCAHVVLRRSGCCCLLR